MSRRLENYNTRNLRKFCGLEDLGSVPGGDSDGISFIFVTAFRPALGPTQPHIQWIPRNFSSGLMCPYCEVDHPPPSSAEFKNAWSYASAPQYVFMSWSFIKKELRLH